MGIPPKKQSENFNRHWDQKRYASFRKRVHSHALTARQAREESSIEDASLEWTTVEGLYSRIDEWCENTLCGWEDDYLGLDALMNFAH